MAQSQMNTKKKRKSVNLAVSHVLKVECEKKSEKILSESITEFWRLDSIDINQKEILMDNEYMGNITFENNRYIAELPFKGGHPMLSDKFTLCKKRLKCLKERLDKNKELKLQYDQIIKDQLKCGVIEEICSACTLGNVTYLPEVIRTDKSTTKLRIVYDGGAKRKNNVSLNEILHKGTMLTPNLYSLLLKFRVHTKAITADIEKAYHQVEIKEKHSDILRFLWYSVVFANNPHIVRYRFCRVMFGLAPSQYLLNAAIRKHGEMYEAVDPEFTKKIGDFYVDDLTTGANNVSEGTNITKK